MKKLLKNKKGITLVELLITIALIGIVLSIIYNMFFISAKN
ncbi:pilus assembly FimT family protein, partial [Sporanaerobacter acetigenes]